MAKSKYQIKSRKKNRKFIFFRRRNREAKEMLKERV